MANASATTSDEQMLVPMCSIFRRFLKRQGLKFTPERAQILDAVLAKEGVFEADELLYEMREANTRVSKATIYRTLKHLMEARIINEVLIDPKQAHYELALGKSPKGHLVCMETHQVIEFEVPEMVALRDKICKKHGWEPLSFRFIVYGRSPEAKQANSD